jgi:hypothetical protein
LKKSLLFHSLFEPAKKENIFHFYVINFSFVVIFATNKAKKDCRNIEVLRGRWGGKRKVT